MKSFDLKTFFQSPQMSIADKKSALRKAIIEERGKESPSRLKQLSEALSEIALLMDEVSSAQTIALYVSRPSEPGTNLLLEILRNRKKTVLLPVLGEKFARDWARFTTLDDLQERITGRPFEPSSPPLGESAIEQVDLILTPAVGVDTRGNRLGHGGGWYDRILAKRPEGVKAYAMVFENEVFDADYCELPVETHDQSIDGIITPKRFLRL